MLRTEVGTSKQTKDPHRARHNTNLENKKADFFKARISPGNPGTRRHSQVREGSMRFVRLKTQKIHNN
jgi:hypothetical protein